MENILILCLYQCNLSFQGVFQVIHSYKKYKINLHNIVIFLSLEAIDAVIQVGRVGGAQSIEPGRVINCLTILGR